MKYRNCMRVMGTIASILLIAEGEVSGLTITFVDPGSPATTPGHPERAWTDVQKNIVNEALAEWVFHDVKSPSSWTLRWEDADLFKDWHPLVGAPDPCDLTTALGVTGIPTSFVGCDIPLGTFPESEIYFRTTADWFFDDTPAFSGDDTGEVPNGFFDFLTVAKHELGHAFGIFGMVEHLPDGAGGAMEEHLSPGERDRITQKDIELARTFGLVPGPSSLILLGSALAALSYARHRTRRKIGSENSRK